MIPTDSITTGSWAEGTLYMESASDGQVVFYTYLQLPSHNGTKTMTVKIDPGAQVNTIPLSKYCLLFPKKLTKSKFLKAKAILPTYHTWISHDGSPKPFLGHFTTEVMHASEPRLYPTHLYVFEDTTSPHIVLSYTTLERLDIVAFKVPNLAATSKVDHVVLAPPSPSDQRKTIKNVTFQGPIQEMEETRHKHKQHKQ